MGYKLLVSKDAHQDIERVTGYIVHGLISPQAASGFLDDVEKSYRLLQENPRIFALCQDARLKGLEYRKVVIKNDLVLYRLDEDEKTVYIVRVVYGPRNYPDLL